MTATVQAGHTRERKATSAAHSTGPAHCAAIRPDIAYTVHVVDGDGIEVPGEPVTADFDLGGGDHRVLTETTNQWGRARFIPDQLCKPVSVAFEAGRETTGAVEPTPNQSLTIET